jgi:hypothetical protein
LKNKATNPIFAMQFPKKQKRTDLLESRAKTPPLVDNKQLVIPLIKDSIRNEGEPILAQNHDLDEAAKYRLDISLRPPEQSIHDYEIPVENFGLALLKGMGWAEGQVVGKNSRGVVAAQIAKPRPHLLGLGAAPTALEPEKPKRVFPGDNIQKPPQFREKTPPPPRKDLKIGCKCSIIDGSHQGKSGIVHDIQQRSNGTVVKVKLPNGDIVRVWDDQVAAIKTDKFWVRPHIKVVFCNNSADH